MAATNTHSKSGDTSVNPSRLRRECESAGEYAFRRLQATDRTFSPSELADEFLCSADHMQRSLSDLVNEGVVERADRGEYQFAGLDDVDPDLRYLGNRDTKGSNESTGKESTPDKAGNRDSKGGSGGGSKSTPSGDTHLQKGGSKSTGKESTPLKGGNRHSKPPSGGGTEVGTKSTPSGNNPLVEGDQWSVDDSAAEETTPNEGGNRGSKGASGGGSKSTSSGNTHSESGGSKSTGLPSPVSSTTLWLGIGVLVVLVLLYIWTQRDDEDDQDDDDLPVEEEQEVAAAPQTAGGLTTR